MGCDIHLVIEHKKQEGGFFGEDTYDLPRNYAIFSALAKNVRGDNPNAIPARGVPEDASGTYKDMVYNLGPDGHSHSWLTKNELKAALDSIPSGQDHDAYNHLEQDLNDGDRVCFCFDN